MAVWRCTTVVQMAGKPRLASDLLTDWQERLTAAAQRVKTARDDAVAAELELRALILEAFAAGLSVTPIVQATGLSLGRVYQIKRGTRR